MLKRLWREDEGVLTFEWILLLTLLVIGVIGGVAGIRDAIMSRVPKCRRGDDRPWTSRMRSRPRWESMLLAALAASLRRLAAPVRRASLTRAVTVWPCTSMATSSTVPVTVTAGACGL